MSDLISREALIKGINQHCGTIPTWAKVVVISEISEQPSVEAVPVVHGEWIIGSKPRCSICGKSALREYDREDWLSYVPSDFCPNCGAHMRKKV